MIVGGDSGKVHSTVKERWLQGDKELVDGMQRLGTYADLAVRCLNERKLGASLKSESLAALMEKNFALRRALYNDEVVGKHNIEVAALATSLGLSVKFSGSGGAFVCMKTDGTGW